MLIGGACAISPACPASVTGATITHGIRISAGSPAILRLDGKYRVLRANLYIDGNSAQVLLFRMSDISDPSLPTPDGALQFSAPTPPDTAALGNYFQLPISASTQQISLSVDEGTVDLVGYVEILSG